MPTFFFDHEHYTDDEGEAFPDADAAAWEAVLALGDAARDHARQNFRGRLAIRVRDDEGPILEVSATFEVSPIRK